MLRSETKRAGRSETENGEWFDLFFDLVFAVAVVLWSRSSSPSTGYGFARPCSPPASRRIGRWTTS